jgi:hypothetical protein
VHVGGRARSASQRARIRRYVASHPR